MGAEQELGLKVKKLLACNCDGEDGTEITLSELGNGNLMIQQGRNGYMPNRVFLSWEELDELVDFHREYHLKLEQKEPR